MLARERKGEEEGVGEAEGEGGGEEEYSYPLLVADLQNVTCALRLN